MVQPVGKPRRKDFGIPPQRVNGQPAMVYLEWIDSSRTEGWCTRKDIEVACVPSECRTAGFLVHEDDKIIVVALNNAYGEHVGSPYGSLITIPKFAITLRAPIEAFYSKKSC